MSVKNPIYLFSFLLISSQPLQALTFEDSGQSLPSSNLRGAAAADLDGDGDTDIFIANTSPYRIESLINDGAGNFSSLADPAFYVNAKPTRVALADLDGDGDLDAFVTYEMNSTSVNPQDIVFLNDGTGLFTDSGVRIGSGDSKDVTLGDVDGDGDIDAYVVSSSSCSSGATWCDAEAKKDKLWLNDGSANFTEGSAVWHHSATTDADFGDVDGDGDLDLLVVNTSTRTYLMSNDGSGNFTDSGQGFGFKSGKSLWARLIDLDGDGDLDAYEGNQANTQAAGDRVYFNDGAGNFTNSNQALSALQPFGIDFSDLDNDGDLDVYVGTFTSSVDEVWLNDGSGVFTNGGTIAEGQTTYAVALADYDGDADVDVFLGSFTSGVQNKLLLNEQAANCFVATTTDISAETIPAETSCIDLAGLDVTMSVAQGQLVMSDSIGGGSATVRLSSDGSDADLTGIVLDIGVIAIDINGQIAILTPAQAATAFDSQQTTLQASNGSATDLFGGDVALYGDLALVGSPLYDDQETDSGAAFIYRFNGTAWVEDQKLVASTQISGSRFGETVALYENHAIVSAPSEASSQGAVYVFYRDSSGTWSQQAHLTAADGSTSDGFGSSIAIDGDILVIGAKGNAEPVIGSAGAVYIFRHDCSFWTEEAKLLSSDLNSGDSFGHAVAITGETIVVSAIGQDVVGSNSGAAYVFENVAGVWTESQKLVASDAADGDIFGVAISLNSDATRLVIGASGVDLTGTNLGAAYVFEDNGSGWVESQKLTASSGVTNDKFGQTVAIDDDLILIGAPFDDPNPTQINNAASPSYQAGTAYSFRFDGSSWVQESILTPNGHSANDGFGSSVAVQANRALVGSLVLGSQGYVSLINAGSVVPPVAITLPGANDFCCFGDDATGDTDNDLICDNLDACSGDDFSGDSDSDLICSDIDICPLDADNDADGDGVCGDVDVCLGDDATGDSDLDGICDDIDLCYGDNASGDGDSDGLCNDVDVCTGIDISGDSDNDGICDSDDFWNIIEGQTIQPSAGHILDIFGADGIVISGNVLITGSSLHDEFGRYMTNNASENLGSGAAFIYRHNGTEWVEEARLLADDRESGDRFGVSVDIEGDTAVVGNPEDDNGRGAAYVFNRINGVWTQTAKLVGSTTDGSFNYASGPLSHDSGDSFGRRVDISGDTILIGAHSYDRGYTGDNVGEYEEPEDAVGSDGIGSNYGAAFVFRYVCGQWVEEARIDDDNGQPWDLFGGDVVLNGDTAFIASPKVDAPLGGNIVDVNNDAGAVFVYQRTGSQWEKVHEILPTQRRTENLFGGLGVNLSDDGQTLLVTGTGDYDQVLDSHGNIIQFASGVHVFGFDGTQWIEDQVITPSDTGLSDKFGHGSIDIFGDHIIVGASLDDPDFTITNSAENPLDRAGTIYHFVKENGVWTEQTKIIPQDHTRNLRFGFAVALEGGHIAAAPFLSGRSDHSVDGVGPGRITFFEINTAEPWAPSNVPVLDPAANCPINTAPVLSPIGAKSVDENSLLSFTISANDSESVELVYSATGLPAGASFDALTQTFSWLPGFDAAGVYSVTFSVTDDGVQPFDSVEALTTEETITITVNNTNRAPVFNVLSSQTVNENEALNFTLTASDLDGDVLSYSAINLPAGASLNSTTGDFSWTPSYADAGTFNIDFVVSDNGAPAMSEQMTVTLIVSDVNRAPVLNPIGSKLVNEGFLLSFPVVASDPDADVVSITASNLPGSASFDIASNTFNWVPSFAAAGVYSVTFTVTDSGSPALTAEETISISVVDVNLSPVLTEIGAQSVNEDESLQFTVSASDPDGNGLIFSASNLPTGASFDVNTQEFSWTPSFSDAGNYDVTFTVVDDHPSAPLSVEETVTISVADINRAPVLNAIGAKIGDENELMTFSISATDIDGDAITYAAVNLPSGASFDSATQTFTWTPSYEDTGIYEITFIATDSGTPALSDQEVVEITVENVNRAPVLDAIGAKSIDEGQTLQFTLGATDPDGDALTYSPSNLPPGAVFDAATQTFTWTPGFGDAGNYTVIFSVTDNGLPLLSDNESVTITVGDVNRPPVLDSIGAKTVLEAQTLSFTVQANDPDGDALTYSVGSLPAGASFDAATQSFSWTPDYEAMGDYDVVFTVVDAGSPSLSDQELITITVGDVNRPPVLDVIGSKSVDEGAVLEFSVTATDPDGDELIFSVEDLPEGASFDPVTQVFSWTPSFEQEGTYSNIEFTVSDDADPALIDVELVTINVGGVNRPPAFEPIGTQSVLTNEALSFTVNANDPDGDSLVLSADNLPAGASFDAATGVFNWTPIVSQEGNYTLDFVATDSGSPVMTGLLEVVVTVGEGVSAKQHVKNLIEDVKALGLPKNQRKTLKKKLRKAKRHINRGKVKQAVKKLDQFIVKVDLFVEQGHISASDAQALKDSANLIIAILNQ